MEIELKGIQKFFGAVHANNKINLKIPSGTIHGILGENGAGKSTLMKILSGYIRADEGEILLNGKKVNIKSPSDAISYGIGMLHQDPLDFPPLKVIDNFLLGSPRNNTIASSIIPDYSSARDKFLELQSKFNFSIDPDAYIESLTVGERQQIEILRLIWLGVEILIFDEPTTGISLPQKILLFKTLKQITYDDGKTILFVSHKLEDAEELCGELSVLRQGSIVGNVKSPYHISELVNLMFGKQLEKKQKESSKQTNMQLKLEGISYEDYRIQLESINLNINAGEIIGLAGMEGSGQLEFLKICSGLLRPTSGKITLKSKLMTGKTYFRFRNEGVTYLPAGRLEEGLVPGLTLTEHFMLASENQGFFLDPKEAASQTQLEIDDFYIRGKPQTKIQALSGGNQQRALLALMRKNIKLILMEHPTRGLDVESSAYVWNKLKERCKQGTAIIFISSDLEEILDYSDTILVFFAGKVSPPISADSTNSGILGQLIGGKGWPEKSEIEN